MKYLLLVLLLTGISVAQALDADRQIEQITDELQRTNRAHAEAAALEAALRGRVQKVPPGSAEREQLQMELKDQRQLVSALAIQKREKEARIRELKASPEHLLITAIQADKRHPTKANLSGVWDTEANLVGYTMRLEQRGERVSGQGFFWGCTGMYEVFRIAGSYRGEVLSLTFVRSPFRRERHVFHHSEQRGRPCFQEVNSQRPRTLIPFQEVR